MKNLKVDELKKLCNVHSVAGDTVGITTYIAARLKKLGIQSKTNGFGVLLCGNTKNPRILISAHADEVGFQVIKKNPDGTFLVGKSGHIDAVMLNNTNVYVETASGRISGCFYPKKGLGDNKPENFTEIFLDTVDNDAVTIGDFGSYQRVFSQKGNKIIATGLDNKIGVELLLAMIEEKPALLKNILFTFVTEEETTYDCIAGVASEYKPEYAIVIDMCPVNQTSPGKVESLPEIGKGPGVLYAMSNYHINPVLRKSLEKMKLDYQKVFLDINFPPEPQMTQKNGITKGMNVFIPMFGWHNCAYSMDAGDFGKTKVFVQNIVRML